MIGDPRFDVLSPYHENHSAAIIFQVFTDYPLEWVLSILAALAFYGLVVAIRKAFGLDR